MKSVSLSLLSSKPQTESKTWTYIRDLTPLEEGKVNDAITHCRRYARRVPVQLVYAGHRNLKHAVARFCDTSESRTDGRGRAQDVETALVGLLLFWRLCLDQVRADLSARFGKTSTQWATFVEATNRCYDESLGYRLAEGLRNFVQHVDMPGLTFARSAGRSRSGEYRTASSCSIQLSPERLLNWKDCPRTLRNDLAMSSQSLSVVDLIDDAITAFGQLTREIASIDEPELDAHLGVLQSLVDEADPDQPILCDISGLGDDPPFNLELTMFDDLLPLLRLTHHG